MAEADSETPGLEEAEAVGTEAAGAYQPQEGIDLRKEERLCGWRSALKGEPHGRDRHETRPAGTGRKKALRA
jgi:hypothetical protein